MRNEDTGRQVPGEQHIYLCSAMSDTKLSSFRTCFQTQAQKSSYRKVMLNKPGIINTEQTRLERRFNKPFNHMIFVLKFTYVLYYTQYVTHMLYVETNFDSLK